MYVCMYVCMHLFIILQEIKQNWKLKHENDVIKLKPLLQVIQNIGFILLKLDSIYNTFILILGQICPGHVLNRFLRISLM